MDSYGPAIPLIRMPFHTSTGNSSDLNLTGSILTPSPCCASAELELTWSCNFPSDADVHPTMASVLRHPDQGLLHLVSRSRYRSNLHRASSPSHMRNRPLRRLSRSSRQSSSIDTIPLAQRQSQPAFITTSPDSLDVRELPNSQLFDQ